MILASTATSVLATPPQCFFDGGTLSSSATANCQIQNTGATTTAASGGTITNWLAITGNNTTLTLNSGSTYSYDSDSGGGMFNPNPKGAAISVSGSAQSWVLNNSGSMQAGNYGGTNDLINIYNAGNYTINNSGTINDGSDNSNSHTIASSANGIYLTINNSSTGTIKSDGDPGLFDPTGATIYYSPSSGASGAFTVINSGTITTKSGINAYAIQLLGPGNHLVRNSGTITSGNSTTIVFGSGVNQLILEPTSSISGTVDAGSGGSDTFSLGGNSGSGSFDLTQLGPKYKNFNGFEKIESNTWTLVNTNSNLTNLRWVLNGGTLALSSGATFKGDVLNPSTASSNVALQVSGTINSSTSVAIEMDGPGNNLVTLNSGSAFGSGTFNVGGGYVTLLGPQAFPNEVKTLDTKGEAN